MKVLTLLERNILSPSEASFSRREAGARVKRKRVGGQWKGKRGSEAFPFFPLPTVQGALALLLLLLFSLEYPAGASAEEKE